MDSYTDLEPDEGYPDYPDYAEFEPDGSESEDPESTRKRKRWRIPGRLGRPYALGTKGVVLASISNGSGKTAQIKLPAPAVTVPEFRKAMSEVQRDVQGSAKVIGSLRDELESQKRAARRIQKSAAWAANAGILVQFIEQAKDVLVDVLAAHDLTNNPQPRPPGNIRARRARAP